MNSDQWCLIESDPGVFTELIRGFGVSGVQVEELYSLSEGCFEHLKPVHGLIFLFKWVPDNYSEGTLLTSDTAPYDLFFAQQVINNACATQALISILLNCKHPDLKLGQTLSDFKEFVANFDPTMKGFSLTNAEKIRTVHNSFSRQQMFEFDLTSSKKEKEDVFHFISYIPFGGRLLELDGLKEGPFDLGPIPDGKDWVEVARPHIEKRMQKYSEGEIHFNLMALISDLKMVYNKKIQELSGKDTLEAKAEIKHFKELIAEEEAKNQRFKVENIRRKHNYLPLIVETLKALGKKGKLIELYDKALEKAKAQNEKKINKVPKV